MTQTQIQIQIRVDAATKAWLDDRAARYAAGSTPQQIRADLTTLQGLMAVEARRLPLTAAEAQCLAAISSGTMATHAIGQLLHAEVSDAFRLAREADPTGGAVSSYAAQFGIDEEHLLKRLASLGPAGDLAVRDALSRWWATHSGSDNGPESFRAAGLTILDTGE
ncbi:hypothetical protein [Phytoactinopolyspora limicola]|uniref:hypothetical protein n=1 Tax=Phytoactinopolyspora limicola TaxID=2715536 RepID=UPI00140C1761|nr:hypothetical protein [Phytoactinopolyspora limicola]